MTERSYGITIFKQVKARFILLTGFILSFVIAIVAVSCLPIPNETILMIVIAGFVGTFLIMKKYCRIRDNIELFNDRFVSKFYGIIEFKYIKTYNYNDVYTHWNIIKIILRDGRKLAFIDDTVGEEFKNFQESLWKAILEYKVEANPKISSNIKEKDFFKSEYAKPFGIGIIGFLSLVIIWSIFSGKMTPWILFRVSVLLMIMIPSFMKIFRK